MPGGQREKEKRGKIVLFELSWHEASYMADKQPPGGEGSWWSRKHTLKRDRKRK